MLKKILRWERKVEKEIVPYIDKLFYLGGILSPTIASVQAYKIFVLGDATAVSLFTWTSYLLGALAMLLYGIGHKQKPIIFMNSTVIPVYILIIIGILIYG